MPSQTEQETALEFSARMVAAQNRIIDEERKKAVEAHDKKLESEPKAASFYVGEGLRLEREAVLQNQQAANPKTLMGNMKVPNLSVIPFSAILEEGIAMRYGAFEAPRKDGGKGYGPFNWRDQPIEYMVYIDAAMRHLASAADREDVDPVSKATHLGHARATIGILIDAIAHGTAIDNRPKTARGRVATMLRTLARS